MVKYHFFTLCWSAFIIFLALFPGSGMPDFMFFDVLPLDKAVHFFVYFVFTFMLITGFYKQLGGPSYRFKLYGNSMLIALAFSFALEVLQILIPGRNFELWDVAANISGIIAGRAFFFIVYSLKLG